MRIHTSMGTTPTILVIVLTIGDGLPRVDRPRATPRARPARVARTGGPKIPANDAAPPCDSATEAARFAATRLWVW
jgi:hypothetical protein